MWWAEHGFERGRPARDGSVVGQHFAAYLRATGKRHADDTDPAVPMPDAVGYLMRWFIELGHGRPSSNGVLLPIPSAEIAAWARLGHVEVEDWELDTLRLLDAAYVRIMNVKDD